MKRLLYIILLMALLSVQKASAIVWESVNFDYKTVSTITSAYALELGMENMVKQSYDSLLSHYEKSFVAASALYLIKWQQHKELTDVGIWSNSKELFYYRQCVKTAQEVMARALAVADLIIKDPQTAYYWLPYLIKVCNQVRDLCSQFSAIVSNGKYTFTEVTFLEVKEDFTNLMKQYMEYSEKVITAFSRIKNMTGSFNGSSFKAMLNELKDIIVQMGTDVWNSAKGGFDTRINQGKSAWEGGMYEKAKEVLDLMSEIEQMYQAGCFDDINGQFKDLTNGLKAECMFKLSNLTIADYLKNFEGELTGAYYTQTWTIVEEGKSQPEEVFRFTPDNTDYTSSGWYKYPAMKDDDGTPNVTVMNNALIHVTNCCGYSEARAKEEQKANPGYTYNFSAVPVYGGKVTMGGVEFFTMSYNILVTRKAITGTPVYSELFDSATNDILTFEKHMNAKLDTYNNSWQDSDNPKTYSLIKGEKQTYTKANKEMLQQSETVLIYAECQDKGEDIGGQETYKCGNKNCNNIRSAHVQTCAYDSNPSDESYDKDLADLDAAIDSVQNVVNNYNQILEQYNAEAQDLIKKINSASNKAETDSLGNLSRTLTNQIRAATKERDDANSTLQALKQGKHEVEKEAQQAIIDGDGKHRIPYLEDMVASYYELTWVGKGTWSKTNSSQTYTRRAKMGNKTKSEYIFKVVATDIRPKQTILGIRIHRHQVKLKWSITGNSYDKNVVKTITFDVNTDIATKEQRVNEAIHQAAIDNPNCTISQEYLTPPEVEVKPDGERVYHMLIASDRMEIARGIIEKLNMIKGTLIAYEHMMHYKHNYLDVWNNIGRRINKSDWRQHLPQAYDKAYQNWLRSARRQFEPRFMDSQTYDFDPARIVN